MSIKCRRIEDAHEIKAIKVIHANVIKVSPLPRLRVRIPHGELAADLG